MSQIVEHNCYEAVVIGCSAGGMNALLELFSSINGSFSLPMIIVQHLHRTDGGRFSQHLDSCIELPVKEPDDKEKIQPSHVYVAPADYHLLIEQDQSFALSIDPRVNYARPSIDVLFESAARVWGDKLIGVVLSGANHDGALGLQCVAKQKGLSIVQEPSTAEVSVMPLAAMQMVEDCKVLSPCDIGRYLMKISDDLNRYESRDE